MLCYDNHLPALITTILTHTLQKSFLCQLFSDDADNLVEAVNGLNEICDAVDITSSNISSFGTCPTDEDDKWNSWLSCIKRVHQECKAPILCKLSFSQQEVDETIRKGKLLQEAGCEVLLFYLNND